MCPPFIWFFVHISGTNPKVISLVTNDYSTQPYLTLPQYIFQEYLAHKCVASARSITFSLRPPLYNRKNSFPYYLPSICFSSIVTIEVITHGEDAVFKRTNHAIENSISWPPFKWT